jgi:23S rRNA pseudouridine955/2504/2580 synthase
MHKRVAGEDDAGKRFDVVVRKAFPALSLGQIFKAIRSGKITLNDSKALGNIRITTGDLLTYHGFYHENHPNTSPQIVPPSPNKLISLWQNTDLVVFNKPVGMKIHDGNDSMTALVQQNFPTPKALSFKIGPCHRLDRNTSGLVMFAKTAHGARIFMEVQKSHRLRKYYLAIMSGQMHHSFSAMNYLVRYNQTSYVVSSKQSSLSQLALTTFYPLCTNKQASLVLCRLHTGRTHQIRAVSSYYGHPLINDVKYHSKISTKTTPYALHAYALYSETPQLTLNVLCMPHHKEFSILLEQYELHGTWENQAKTIIQNDGLVT